MRLGEEGYFWEPTMETFLRGGDSSPAVPLHQGKGPPRAGAVTALPEPPGFPTEAWGWRLKSSRHL